MRHPATFLPVCFLFFCQIAFSQALLWSDPGTWPSGNVPAAGEDVTITSSMHVIFDEHSADLGGLTIDGILEFADEDLNLTAEYILVNGELHVGSAAAPYTHQALITLTDTDPNNSIGGMGTRGILVMGGTLEMHGDPTATPWTKINAHANAGATSLTLMETVDWENDDRIVISPTDYYGAGTSESEDIQLTNVSGDQLTLANGLNAFRWGLLQYATTSGMSLNNSSPVVPPAPSGVTPTVLDERAYVGNLSRNIVIQAPDDTAWNANGFGCHIMVMRAGSGMNMCSGGTQGCAHIDGVEIRRGGQMGRLGRYPFHWHMLSYEGTQTLNDATGQYIRNSSIHGSANRGIVIHGTNGVEVSDNVVYDFLGHGIFTEDASERRNVIDGNLVLHARNPASPLKNHEVFRGSAAFWISNPDNTLTNNVAGDSQGSGFWLAYPNRTFGLSSNINIIPNRIRFGIFDDNTSFSNRFTGIHLDEPENDEQGNILARQYWSTSDGQEPQWPFPTLERFELTRFNVWKNGHHGLWDRSVWPDNYEGVSADNIATFFGGSGADGMIERCLVVGTSLNYNMNGLTRPNYHGHESYAAFATYHSTFDIQHNIVVGFPAFSEDLSGAFSTEDYYIRPVDKGQVRNIGNLVIDSHIGVKLEAQFNYFALAGALWDPHDNWGGDPNEDNYYVYDVPFFTAGQTPTTVPPGSISGGVLVEGPFYGFNDFIVNQANIEWEDYMEINVDRLDDNFNTVATWWIAEAQPSWGLAHMRHFAAHPDDYYHLTFPGIPEVNDVAMAVENMLTNTDTLVLAVEYSGNYEISQVYISSWYSYMSPGHTEWPTSYEHKHIYTEVSSRQAVVDSPGGQTYWHDTANDVVWIKIQGGIEQPWNEDDFNSTDDELLYREFHLRIWGALPLPVELTEFSASPNEKNEVELKWATASEINHDYFVVQRSANGNDWIDLEKIKGRGNSTVFSHYKSMDKSPLLGHSYYRLKQVDFTGATTYSKAISIFLEKENSYRIFPNPSHGNVYVEFDEKAEDIKITARNINGKIIFEQDYFEIIKTELEFSDEPPGIYFIEINNGGNTQFSRFMKK